MLKLFDYQVESRDFLLNGGSLCADDPGCGKTLVSLDALRASTARIEPGWRNLVVCPAIALGVWEREAEAHGFTTQLVRSVNDLDVACDLNIVSVDLLRNSDILCALLSMRWAHLLVDEAHYAKNPTAQRTRALMELAEETRGHDGRVWLLSGTPTPNHIGEIWALVMMTAPERIRGLGYDEFTRRYCRWKLQRLPKGRMTKVIAGNNRLATRMLMEDLKGWWIRHRKADVLPQLPPKLRRVVPLHGCDLTAVEDGMDTPEGRALLRGIQSGDLDFPEELELHMSRLRRLLAMAKVDAAVQYVRALLPDHPKLLVWGWHTEALWAFAEAMRRASNVEVGYGDGGTPKKQRDAMQVRMQDNPAPYVACLQIKAFGTAITMTEADRAIFLEPSFTPGDNIQAEDRIHRIGQTRGALIDYLAVRGSIDEAAIGVVARKLAEWRQVEAMQ